MTIRSAMRFTQDAELTNDLTSRQIVLLLELRSATSDEQRTVRYLSVAMNCSKPAITRGTDKLVHMDFAKRKPDPLDRRSVLMILTKQGEKFVDAFLSEAERAEAPPPKTKKAA